MRLSEIKGERSLDIVADLMELVGEIGNDKRFDDFLNSYKNADKDAAKQRSAICLLLPPIIRDHKTKVTEVLASIAGVPYSEYSKTGEVLKDITELLTSDIGALDFLSLRGESES